MKIEAKKYKYNLKQNTGDRPAQPIRTDDAPRKSKPKKSMEEKSAEKKPRITLPKITIPKIRVPRFGLPNIKMPDLTISRFKAPKIRGKRSVYIAALLVGAPALLLIVWLGVNLVHRPAQKPLFTENDLPKPPSAESNGYVSLYDDQVAAEYSGKDISDNNMFRTAATMEYYLDKARGEYVMAKTLAAREDVKKMIGLYRETMTKPVFADIAMPRENDLMKVRAYIALHNSVTATIIARLQEKKTGAAYAMMKDQLILNMQYLRSARTMTNFLTAAQAYERSLDILKSMLNQSGGSLEYEALAACKEISVMMRSFNPYTISLAPIVVFEYIMLWKRTFDPSLQRPEAPALNQLKFKKLAFFDRGATQNLYDGRWKELHEYAKHPNEKAYGELMKSREKRYSARRFWWFHNAVGKKYLDTIPMSVYQLFPESKSRGEMINRKQGEIITIIDALKEAAPEKKPVRKKGGKQVKKPVKKMKARKPAA